MNKNEKEANKPVRVVFYGRVSTEHEAQISALDNQMDWYRDLAARHPEWTVVGQYVDEGITGTDASKRPSFQRMVEDAKAGKFDTIVTREVSRFARNTVDALNYTRDLKKMGVEVYFVADDIRTMSGDGELRLALMATLAQEESRKVRERVMSGLAVAKEKGVLLGNGNIIGYDLDKANNTYVINEEQAETVRMIYELYASGLGMEKVAKVLMERGRKDGAGHVKWDASKVTRVLRKPTYMGYCVYNCSRTTDYLEHTRVTNHDNETYVRVKGNFPAIIDEELWLRCDAIRKSRNMHLLDENGKPKKYGCTVAKNVWVTKLVCSCGSRFRRFEWNTRADGTKVYGFACYRSSKRSLKYLQQHGLPEGICEQTDFPQWKLELMAVKVFDMVWNTRREAVLEACRMLNECYRQENADPEALRQLDENIEKLNGMVEKLIAMRAADRITLEQFLSQSSEVSLQLQRAKNERAALKSKAENSQGLDMDAIEASLCEAVRLEDGKVNEWFIETFVKQITPLPGDRFAWVLDLAPTRQTVICTVDGQKKYPRVSLESNLFRGAWSAPDLPREFLLDEAGAVNGDISAEMFGHDRLPSRLPASNCVGADGCAPRTA